MKWWIISKTSIDEIKNKEKSSVFKLVTEAEKQQIDLQVFTPEQFDIIVAKDDRKSIRVYGEIMKILDFVVLSDFLTV
mgnify:CR=1 FL=1